MTKILLADDDKGMLRSMKSYFERHPGDREVYAVSSGWDALSYLQNHKPDVILTDCFERQQKTGPDVIAEAIKQNPHARGIVLTGKLEIANELFRQTGRPGVYIIAKGGPESFTQAIERLLHDAKNLNDEEWNRLVIRDEARVAAEWRPEFERERLRLIENECRVGLKGEEKVDFEHLMELHGEWLDALEPRLDLDGLREDLEKLRALKATKTASSAL